MKKISFFKYAFVLVAVFTCMGIFTACSDDDDDKLSLSVEGLPFDSETLNKTFEITSNVAWTVSSDQSWCTVTPTSGNGNAEIKVTVTEYDNYKESRKAKITVTAVGLSPETIEVSQVADVLPTPKEVKLISTSTAANEWEYFSFEKGDFVTVDKENAAKDATWDIAFQRFYIRTNSGTSGDGKGGAIDTEKKEFDGVATVPTSGFVIDEKINMMTTMGSYAERSANTAFKIKNSYSWAWYEYMEGTWYINDNVFVIRTANGEKYAKIIMKSYKGEKNESGHITFEYVYPFY